MITLDHVTVSYGDVTPIRDLGVTFPSGSSTAVIGPSGSGKSTLLRLIAGMQSPASGEISIDDTPVTRASWRRSSDPRVSLVHQDYRLVPFLTVLDNLLLAAELRGLRRSEEDVTSALSSVALPESYAQRLPMTLSGGEQQRVAIARSLMSGACVLLADEPTGALDTGNTERVTDILLSLGHQQGLTVVVATHDLTVADRLDHCLSLADGELASSR